MENKKIDAGEHFKQILEQMEKADAAKRDLIVSTDAFQVTDNGSLLLDGIDGTLGFTDTGFSQFCNTFGMPVQYARKCLSRDPKMFTEHMRVWMNDMPNDKERLVRMYQTNEGDHRIRAVLSPKYGIMDNLPIFKEMSWIPQELDADVRGFGLTPDHFDLRFRMPNKKRVIGKLRDDVTDDWVMPGLHIRNSETGMSKLTVTMFIDRLVCSNGMVVSRNTDQSFSRRHIGRMEIDVTERVETIIGKIDTTFDEYVEQMVIAKSDKIIDMEKYLNRVIERDFTQAQGNRIRQAFDQEPGNTRHHAIQAITAAARDIESWTDRLEMEKKADDLLIHA